MMRRALLLLVAIVVVGLYLGGTFDHLLVSVGLNAKPCARNGFGATFCGQELTEYRERLEHAKEAAEDAGQKIEELAGKADGESHGP